MPEGETLDPAAFVAELDAANRAVLDRMRAADSERACRAKPPAVAAMLRAALRNELEATEIAARWLPSTPLLDAKLALARQVGDEAKHFRLIAERLRALGQDPDQPDPLAAGWSPLFRYLDTLTDPVARIAAAHFTREGIACVKNAQFAEACELQGDHATAALYRDVITPDETHHHDAGRRLLLKYAATPEAQGAARAAARRTLELAEETQDAAWEQKGVARGPGC